MINNQRTYQSFQKPLILFRGKPITVDETMRLITGEEPLWRIVSHISENPETFMMSM